jgi:hypothetical protein
MQQVTDMQRVVKLLESIDKKLGAKDCVDETKEGFLAALDARVKALELETGLVAEGSST